ncbi:hypothetical protein BGZ95_003299, partial [Linnemannia exigua]
MSGAASPNSSGTILHSPLNNHAGPAAAKLFTISPAAFQICPAQMTSSNRVAHILTLTPNLVVLDLRVDAIGLDGTLFDALLNLTHLKKLSIDRPLYYIITIECMFPLLERLDELEVEGYWLTRLTGPLLLSEKCWALKRLRITSGNNLSLLEFCPNLRRFEFYWRSITTTTTLSSSWKAIDALWPEMYRYLRDLTDLTTLEIDCGYGPV